MLCSVPIWSPDKGVGGTGDGGRTKICQFHLPWLCQQDVSCLDISVRHIRGNDHGARETTERPGAPALGAQRAQKKPHSPVNQVVGVKISQASKSTMGDCSYFNLLQRFLVNWRGTDFTNSESESSDNLGKTRLSGAM